MSSSDNLQLTDATKKQDKQQNKGKPQDKSKSNPNDAKFQGLMRAGDVKIGAIGPDGKVIESNRDVKAIRSYIQIAQKELKAGKPLPPYISEATAATEATAIPTSEQTQTTQTKNNDEKTNMKSKEKSQNTTTKDADSQDKQATKQSDSDSDPSFVLRDKTKKQHHFFAHIPQYDRPDVVAIYEGARKGHIHPSFLSLGHAYSTGLITGTTARTLALCNALLDLIRDFTSSSSGEFSREFMTSLSSHIRFVAECRQLAIPMTSLLAQIKTDLSTYAQVPDAEAKEFLISRLTEMKSERIETASHVLASHGQKRISDGDTILIYGFSHAVELVLLAAHEAGKKFKVIIVDSKPKLEGQYMLERLVLQGLDCQYTLIHCAANVMKSVSRVFLGASAMLSNGSLLARVGSALIATVAKSSRVPVLVCCETFKFSGRVQLDSICANEIGNPDELLFSTTNSAKATSTQSSISPLDALMKAGLVTDNSKDTTMKKIDQRVINWRQTDNLKLLNITYDVTPIDLISCLVTEMGIVPPTSVPVILREFTDSSF